MNMSVKNKRARASQRDTDSVLSTPKRKKSRQPRRGGSRTAPATTVTQASSRLPRVHEPSRLSEQTGETSAVVTPVTVAPAAATTAPAAVEQPEAVKETPLEKPSPDQSSSKRKKSRQPRRGGSRTAPATTVTQASSRLPRVHEP
ncbi:MAG: hypothetical protein V1899_03240, partial [Planctomycetota bacterium]